MSANPETHTMHFEENDVTVEVTLQGDVNITLRGLDLGPNVQEYTAEEFSNIVDFIEKHAEVTLGSQC